MTSNAVVATGGGGSQQVTINVKSGTILAAPAGAKSLTYTRTSGAAPAIGDVFDLDAGAVEEFVTVKAVTGSGPYTLTVDPTTFGHAAAALACEGGRSCNLDFTYATHELPLTSAADLPGPP